MAYRGNLGDEDGHFTYWHGLRRVPGYTTLAPSRLSHDSDESDRSRSREMKINTASNNLPASRPTTPGAASVATGKTYFKSQSYRAQTWQYVRKLSLTETWYFETIAISLSLTAFGASILLLAFQDGRPIHNWACPVSLNTIVAILGAVSRACLAFAVGAALGQDKWNWFKQRPDQLSRFDCFEEASRGPWGSVRLLLSIGVRHIPTMGALAMVILLGFEAFLQAIVNYEGQIRLAGDGSGTATLLRNERLNSGYYQPCLDNSCPAALKLPVNGSATRDEVNIPSWGSYPHVSLISAFYKGLDQNTPTTVNTYACPTGNCTYPRYTSLGFCSKCNDVTGSIVKTVKSSDIADKNTSTAAVQKWNKYSLPYVSMSDETRDLTIAHGVLDSWRTIAFQDLDTMIMAFGILSRDEDTEEPTASECAVYMCASLYEATVRGGAIDEVKIDSWAVREEASWEILFPDEVPVDWKFPDVDNWTPILGWYNDGEQKVIAEWDDAINQSVAVREHNLLRSDLQIVIPEADVEKYGLGREEETSTYFNFSQATIASTLTWLGNGMANELVFYSIRNGSYGRNTDLAYWETRNYTAGFERLATVLSSWARGEGETAQTVAGEVYQWMLITRVNWPFLALPAITMVLGLTYFVLSVTEAKNLGLKPWKGSTLAILAMGLDGESRSQLRHMSTKEGFEESGRNIRVHFDEGRGCGELKGEGTV